MIYSKIASPKFWYEFSINLIFSQETGAPSSNIHFKFFYSKHF